jgi:hypothetical protein
VIIEKWLLAGVLCLIPTGILLAADNRQSTTAGDPPNSSGAGCTIGDPNPGSTSKEALLAAFTTCAANWDFSQSHYATSC